MTNSFPNQTIAQIELFTKTDEDPAGVYRLPSTWTRRQPVALGLKLTTLTKEQASYLGVSHEGPDRPDRYRH